MKPFVIPIVFLIFLSQAKSSFTLNVHYLFRFSDYLVEKEAPDCKENYVKSCSQIEVLPSRLKAMNDIIRFPIRQSQDDDRMFFALKKVDEQMEEDGTKVYVYEVKFYVIM